MEEGDILDIGDLGVEEQNLQNKGAKKDDNQEKTKIYK